MNSMTQTNQLKRGISLTTAIAIVVGNMIGSGIFITTGFVADKVPGPGWVLLCWIIGGLIAISGALCYVELSTRMPEVGGEYVYLKKLYHPLFGFLTGWTSLIVGFSAPIASSSLSFAEYTFAGLDIPLSVNTVVPKKIAAILIILMFTIVHYLGVRLGSKVQNILTAFKMIIVFGLAAIGFALGSGQGLNLSFHSDSSFNALTFGTAMMLVMFSYSGWNASAYIAGELKNPKKSLPISLLLGTTIVIILYLSINLFIVKSVPFAELKGTTAVVEAASMKTFGAWIGKILSLLVAIALLSSLSAFIMIGPRVYFAMAKDRLFLPFAGRIHPKYEVPGRSIIIQAFIAILMVLISSIEPLLLYIIFALNIFPWLAVFGLFLARRKAIGEDTAVKVWGYPIIPIFFLTASLTLMIVMYLNKPVESTAAVITVLLGIPCYFLWVKGVKLSTKFFTKNETH
ncbi:MAG: amino acid permease [bacterium]|nr:MAG: amino acid permease [bacterium]